MMAQEYFDVARKAWRSLLLALSAALLIGLAPIGQAQAKWPEKPVRIVLPFGAGGVADFTTRILADKLSTKFGQRVIVENKAGPGGINAALTVLNAPADGYTMGLAAIITALSAATFNKLPYDPLTQFEMVSTIGVFDMDFAVKADSPYQTLGDFIKAANEQPGKFNIGTIAIGSAQNFGTELFKSMAKVNAVIVPHHNSPDVVIALLRDDLQMVVDFAPALQGQINSKQLRVLATSGTTRSVATPDVPTADEAGVKGYEVTSWNGLFAPKGTPKEVIDTMNSAMHEVLAMPEVKAQFEKVGVEPHASKPEELMDRLKSDIKKWDKVVAETGMPKK
jgi:tripartite-type tricarboxylate transporter receptor subunit TctC